MTEEQDKRLKDWKYKNGKEKDAMKPNYASLCRCLFENGVKVPENPAEYHYYLPEYTVNESSHALGLRNLEYVSSLLAAQTVGSQHQLNPPDRLPPNPISYIDPLQLDEPSRPHPHQWGVQKPTLDLDSAYGSNEANDIAQRTSSDNACLNPLWLYPNTRWGHSNVNVASIGAFSQEALYPRPDELELELWVSESSDGPSG
ncbi:hypothetical protein HD806DRAFT_524972 [Xylariaceae sp. AK1471]|nr:hypothetical protein HD806DRAFT_524972 [Xylariaceae sp. AK1471]